MIQSRQRQCLKLGSELRAINEYPLPKNTTELKRFRHVVTIFKKFINQCETISVAAFRQLLRKNQRCQWTETEPSAFKKIEAALCKCAVEPHDDPSQPLTMKCDASPYGVGGFVVVVVHPGGSGDEITAASTSRIITTINRAEKRGSSSVARKDSAFTYSFGISKFTPNKKRIVECRRILLLVCSVGQSRLLTILIKDIPSCDNADWKSYCATVSA